MPNNFASEEYSITEKQLDNLPRGSKGLCKMAALLGYKDPLHQLQVDSTCSVGDLLYFFDDNPGAIEALTEWVRENFVNKEHETRLGFIEMSAALVDAAHSDSRVELDEAKLRMCLLADLEKNGDRCMSESECEEFITGGDEGEVSEELKTLFPKTHEFVASYWE